VWESNLLGADSSSTYEEGLGWNWKDLASFGTVNAAFLPPRFFIPLFSWEEPFRRLDCWPPVSHRAPLVCRCSLSCECPNAAEVPVEPSSPLATYALSVKSARKAESFTSEDASIRQVDCFGIARDSGTVPKDVANRLRRRPLLRTANYWTKWSRAIPTAPFTLFPDFRKLDRGDGNHCVELVPAFAPVQGQLLGAGRPANRARIQLICSLTDSPMTALPARFGYRINSTRSFCRHSRATAVAITADGAS
jgi:hypothetical protein